MLFTLEEEWICDDFSLDVPCEMELGLPGRLNVLWF
jgi:hypothetical protein